MAKETKMQFFELMYNHPMCKTCPIETKQYCLTPGNPGPACRGDYVLVIGSGNVKCPKCGHEFCPTKLGCVRN